MITEVATFSRHIKGPDAAYKTYAESTPLRKLRHFVEQFDWDGVLAAQGKWLDMLCCGVLVAAALYFAPLIWVKLLLE